MEVCGVFRAKYIMTDVESSFHPALRAVREMGKKEDKEMIRENKN